MKKVLISILAFLYLSTSVGATVHLHYCMEKLVGWGLSHSNSKKCSNCGMEKSAKLKNNCCKDEQKQVKLDSDQKATTPYEWLQVTADVPVYNSFSYIVIPTTLTERFPVSHAPPVSNTSIYLRNCVFLI